jgi:hypothetical protein
VFHACYAFLDHIRTHILENNAKRQGVEKDEGNAQGEVDDFLEAFLDWIIGSF